MAFPFTTAISGVTRLTAAYINTYIFGPLVDLDDRLRYIFTEPTPWDYRFHLPKYTTAQRDALNNNAVLDMIANTTTGKINIYTAAGWIELSGSGTSDWGSLTTSDSVPIGMFLKTTGLEAFSLTTLNDEIMGAYPNAEVDATKTLHPDGHGGFVWRIPVHAHVKTFDVAGDFDWDVPNDAHMLAYQVLGAGGGGGGGRASVTANNGASVGSGGGGGARGQFKSKIEAAYLSKRHFRVHIGAGGSGGAPLSNGVAGSSSWIRVLNPSTGGLNDIVLSSVGGDYGRGARSGSGGQGGLRYDSRGGWGSGTQGDTLGIADDAGGGPGGGFYWYDPPGGLDSDPFLKRARDGGPGGGAYTFLSGISASTGALGGSQGTGTNDGSDGADATADGNYFGKGAGGGGGAVDGDGGDGGDGWHGSAGGGGAGCPFGHTPGTGGRGADGVIRFIWW